jgi:putative tricarboxylic transport membrane protein
MQLTRTQWRGDLAVAVVCLAVGAAAIREAQSYPDPANGYPGPGLFPVFVGAVLALCGVLLLLRVLLVIGRTRARGMAPELSADRTERPTRRALVDALAVLLAVPAYVLLAGIVGFFLAVALVAAGLMVVLGARVLRLAVPVALGVAAFVWYVFGELLSVPLPTAIWSG